MGKKKREEDKPQLTGSTPKLPPITSPVSNRLLVEIGCYNCNERTFVRIDPLAGGNQFACARCKAQNLVLLRPYTVAYVRAVCES